MYIKFFCKSEQKSPTPATRASVSSILCWAFAADTAVAESFNDTKPDDVEDVEEDDDEDDDEEDMDDIEDRDDEGLE